MESMKAIAAVLALGSVFLLSGGNSRQGAQKMEYKQIRAQHLEVNGFHGTITLGRLGAPEDDAIGLHLSDKQRRSITLAIDRVGLDARYEEHTADEPLKVRCSAAVRSQADGGIVQSFWASSGELKLGIGKEGPILVGTTTADGRVFEPLKPTEKVKKQ
jgi:hypothetical protein